MKKTNILILVLATLLLYSCQSIKDGLSGAKSESSDEFLVKKKNPLVMPPNYSDLPKPDDNTYDEENLIKDSNIEELMVGTKSEDATISENYGSAEEFVLKNIKK